MQEEAFYNTVASLDKGVFNRSSFYLNLFVRYSRNESNEDSGEVVSVEAEAFKILIEGMINADLNET
jgi:hypothetical protein